MPWTLDKAKEFVSEIKISPKNEIPLVTDETILMIQELGYIMDARDDYRRKGIFLIQPFFSEIAKRFDLTLKQFLL